MADPKDIAATRQARREFVKHRIDLTLADLRVMHGVVYLKGTVVREKNAGYEDVKTETERIGRILRQVAGIRDVNIDCQFRN